MFGSSLDSSQLLQALYETLYMVTVSLVISDIEENNTLTLR